jgi:predicted GTPase
MEDISQLYEIAENLGLKTVSSSLSHIEKRKNQKNTELIIPLVGEFSAGKTSLLNALINARLETAITPTTSVIFEIRFANSEQRAEIVHDDGKVTEVTDINSLKNSELKNASCVRIFDTSSKIPSSTVLVDTPGLSSLDPNHQKALISYLPLADIILLVMDIEQGGLNASTLRFIKLAELAKKRIYVVMTKCDTKSKADIADVRQSLRNDPHLPIKQVICVSAKEGNLDELYALINTIQQDKNQIVEEITAIRVNDLKNEMITFIDGLLVSSKLSTEELDNNVSDMKHDIEQFHKIIDSVLSELERRIVGISDEVLNDFSRRIQYDLDVYAGNLSKDDAAAKQEVTTQINNTANVFFANFKSSALRELGVLARENRQKSSAQMLPILSLLESFDMSGLNQNALEYNFNLELPNVKMLTTGIVDGGKALLSAGTAIPKVGIAIGGIKAAVEASGALTKLADLITKEKMVKPQRKRLVENFFRESLKPQFEMQLKSIGDSIVSSIQNSLNHAAEEKIDETRTALETLRYERETLKTEFDQRIDSLEKYKAILENE